MTIGYKNEALAALATILWHLYEERVKIAPVWCQ